MPKSAAGPPSYRRELAAGSTAAGWRAGGRVVSVSAKNVACNGGFSKKLCSREILWYGFLSVLFSYLFKWWLCFCSAHFHLKKSWDPKNYITNSSNLILLNAGQGKNKNVIFKQKHFTSFHICYFIVLYMCPLPQKHGVFHAFLFVFLLNEIQRGPPQSGFSPNSL